MGWRALAPCAACPHPETDRLEAKQLRMCLLSKLELRYLDKSQKSKVLEISLGVPGWILGFLCLAGGKKGGSLSGIGDRDSRFGIPNVSALFDLAGYRVKSFWRRLPPLTSKSVSYFRKGFLYAAPWRIATPREPRGLPSPSLDNLVRPQVWGGRGDGGGSLS